MGKITNTDEKLAGGEGGVTVPVDDEAGAVHVRVPVDEGGGMTKAVHGEVPVDNSRGDGSVHTDEGGTTDQDL